MTQPQSDIPALTGQVQAEPIWPVCASHKEVSHSADGDEFRRWCNRCGWNRVVQVRLGNPSGGWGTP